MGLIIKGTIQRVPPFSLWQKVADGRAMINSYMGVVPSTFPGAYRKQKSHGKAQKQFGGRKFFPKTTPDAGAEFV